MKRPHSKVHNFENCALLGHYAPSSGNFLLSASGQPIGPNIRGQGSKLDSWPLKMGPIGCPETSVTNYHYSLRNDPTRTQFSSTSRRKPDVTHTTLTSDISRQYVIRPSCRNARQNNTWLCTVFLAFNKPHSCQ